jgi:CBS domain-containing protein
MRKEEPMGRRVEERTTVAAVRDLMSLNPVAYSDTSSVQQAAQAMRNQNIGSVIVLDGDGHVCGMVTDRDIVIRAWPTARISAT